MMNAWKTIALLGAMALPTFGSAPDDPAPEERSGDWVVSGREVVRGRHIALDGNLVLPAGAELVLEGSTLEIIGKSSREHVVDWKGGTLTTRDATVGGTNRGAGAIHTVFHLYDGTWNATDTTVRYSYGVSFSETTRGVLRGTRFMAGPRPDAVILSGRADVRLIDSTFPIALGVYTQKGGACTLDLPARAPLTARYDASNTTPGVQWTLELERATVPLWFLFVRNIGRDNPPCRITLARSDELIVSLLGHDLAGELVLSDRLGEPVRLGSLTLDRGEKAIHVNMWALYFSGDQTDVTVRGAAHICELMHRGGRLRLAGTPGKNELSIGCTTTELSGSATITLENVHLGRPRTWQDEDAWGELNVGGKARLIGSNVGVRGVRFRTREDGSINLDSVDPVGKYETIEDGGAIHLNTNQPPASAPGDRR
jgi:hypothetical protein